MTVYREEGESNTGKNIIRQNLKNNAQYKLVVTKWQVIKLQEANKLGSENYRYKIESAQRSGDNGQSEIKRIFMNCRKGILE